MGSWTHSSSANALSAMAGCAVAGSWTTECWTVLSWWGMTRVERRQQLPRRDVLSLGDVDVGDGAARLEVEIELAGGLQIAAA